jgi:hypothetical protein
MNQGNGTEVSGIYVGGRLESVTRNCHACYQWTNRQQSPEAPLIFPELPSGWYLLRYLAICFLCQSEGFQACSFQVNVLCLEYQCTIHSSQDRSFGWWVILAREPIKQVSNPFPVPLRQHVDARSKHRGYRYLGTKAMSVPSSLLYLYDLSNIGNDGGLLRILHPHICLLEQCPRLMAAQHVQAHLLEVNGLLSAVDPLLVGIADVLKGVSRNECGHIPNKLLLTATD